MLVIYKGNIVLKVAMDGSAVRIQPVVGRFDNPQLLHTLARNEELLAQVYVTHLSTEEALPGMARYFEQRGWLVRLPGQTPPAKEDSPWAES